MGQSAYPNDQSDNQGTRQGQSQSCPTQAFADQGAGGSLPAAYGFDSLRAFITALHEASSGSGRAAKKGGKETAENPKTGHDNRRTRARVKQLVKAGKSGSQVAIALGISLPSVQNIKKALACQVFKGFMKPKAPAKVVPKARRRAPLQRKLPWLLKNPARLRLCQHRLRPPDSGENSRVEKLGPGRDSTK